MISISTKKKKKKKKMTSWQAHAREGSFVSSTPTSGPAGLRCSVALVPQRSTARGSPVTALPVAILGDTGP